MVACETVVVFPPEWKKWHTCESTDVPERYPDNPSPMGQKPFGVQCKGDAPTASEDAQYSHKSRSKNRVMRGIARKSACIMESTCSSEFQMGKLQCDLTKEVQALTFHFAAPTVEDPLHKECTMIKYPHKSWSLPSERLIKVASGNQVS